MAENENTSEAGRARFDVIVWGATGYVGKLICAYLVKNYGDSQSLSWAMAGRSESKLKQLHAELSAGAHIPVLTANADDPVTLTRLAQQTKVILTTVGPYAKYGSALVAACVETGTDYVDLTGEAQWIRRMLDMHQDKAEASGARIVPCCGFDSIPSDLGVFFLNESVKKQTNAPCASIRMRVKAMKGGASGGTIDSMINIMEEASRDKQVGKIMRDPYCIAPQGMRDGPRQPTDYPTGRDNDAHGWLAPFVMAGINTRVVHRSNALQDYAYGKEFLYDEAMLMQGPVSAYALTGGLAAFMSAASFGPTRAFLSRFVLPKPGEGPTEKERENGFYNLVFIGKTQDGQTFVARVTGDRDPGYGSTSKMIAESAICLARDIPKEQLKGGFWTPASAMGHALIERLSANAGLTFGMEPEARHY